MVGPAFGGVLVCPAYGGIGARGRIRTTNSVNSAVVPGDVDGDADCDSADCIYLKAYLYKQGPAPPYLIFRADVNCDGVINSTDYTYLYNYINYGGSMPPKCCYWILTDTVSTYYIYSNGQVLAEYDDSGNLVWNYVYGLGQQLARFKYTTQDTVRQVYHNDHLGNVRALTSETGSIISQVDYYPFGDELSLTGSPGRYTYNGNEFDDEYGFDLYYYGARYMDPVLGRFTTPDPVRDFVNPYSYVRNNPMNRIDPTGTTSAPRTIYNMIWIDTFTQFKNDDEDTFFDTRSKKDIVIDAIIEGIKALERMQAKYGSEQDKADWAAMAQWLIDILDPHKPGKLILANPLLCSDREKYDIKQSDVASAELVHDAGTGDLTRANLVVNELFANSSYPTEFLTSYIIQEAAQVRFAQQHHISEFGIGSARELTSGVRSAAVERYTRASEQFGWRHQLTYMSTFVDKSNRKRYPDAAVWYGLLDAYQKEGFDKVFDWIWQNYYR